MGAKFVVKTDHTQEYIAEFTRKKAAALEAIGAMGEAFAKKECPVDTGRLRNSITHATKQFKGQGQYKDKKGNSYSDATAHTTPDGDAAYIGTNVEYASAVEYGDKAVHKVGGAHFLQKAATGHAQEYKEKVQSILKA